MFQKNKSKIKELCAEGKTLEEISKITKVKIWIIQKYIKGIIVKHGGNVDLGYKDGPYYESEDEMLTEINFNNLSDGEREIYIEREKTGELGKYFASPYGFYGGH
jgi:hypothetical protein